MFKRTLSLLRHSRRGSVAIEFALIAPFLITMLLGIFQVGNGMQSYNALRAISADVARHAVVDAQTNNAKKANSVLEAWVEARAQRAPYNLDAARFDVTIINAGTQRVTGATEKTITLTYVVPTVLDIIGLRNITITYTRPVFLIV